MSYEAQTVHNICLKTLKKASDIDELLICLSLSLTKSFKLATKLSKVVRMNMPCCESNADGARSALHMPGRWHVPHAQVVDLHCRHGEHEHGGGAWKLECSG